MTTRIIDNCKFNKHSLIPMIVLQTNIIKTLKTLLYTKFGLMIIADILVIVYVGSVSDPSKHLYKSRLKDKKK